MHVGTGYWGYLAHSDHQLWHIFQKAGYSPGFGILMIVPVVNLILLLWLAFSEWPSLRQPTIVGGRCQTCGQLVEDASAPKQIEQA